MLPTFGEMLTQNNRGICACSFFPALVFLFMWSSFCCYCNISGRYFPHAVSEICKREKKKKLNQNSTREPQFWPLRRVHAWQLLPEMSLNQRSQTGGQLATDGFCLSRGIGPHRAFKKSVTNTQSWKMAQQNLASQLILQSGGSDNPDASSAGGKGQVGQGSSSPFVTEEDLQFLPT